MAEVKILFTGYASADSGGRSCSTVTLVRDLDKNIVVDPGTLPEMDILEKALKEEGLTPDDIDTVFLTHSHLDHFRGIGLFPKAKVLDYWGWWHSDVCTDYQDKVTDNIEMIKTPGHSPDGVTFLVKTADGVIAICGDIFWKEGFFADDPFATDKELLDVSRKKVLGLADYIIPGHGPMFKAR